MSKVEVLANEEAAVIDFRPGGVATPAANTVEKKAPKSPAAARPKPIDKNMWEGIAPPNIAAQPEIDSVEDAPPANGQFKDENKLVAQRAADMAANRGLRETYADKAYTMAGGCISFWVVAVGAQGVVKATTGVAMWSDAVLIAITSGVTVSVLAAFLGVIRGLFPLSSPTGERDSKKKKTTRNK